MVIAGLILAGAAALVHVYIFVMESMAWTSPRVRATFGMSEDEARATKAMAFNQGFYNLFLALIAVAGIIGVLVGASALGAGLVFAGTGSMAGAALVLLLSSPDKRSAALKQGLLPAAAVLALAIGLVL
ncbi:MAG: hypothetical protein B7X41_20370 [Microbacterium sp. 14-71-5]|jgi:putative membrane protein|uniref:DUF1304 domain-containing protein n=1 Tax=Microbacterium sp. 13-71-7 TaxID=1970399 RepID=UPI000BCEFEDA|nr:DUF1304 domain-containing protein [Microbacterium sp. 13-71-7]OZB78068.1 MAG: hypothetical protein B7X41_20370 [Microbacterium sp. 14-71-5]OZB86171.1 MAG: hypothetical protein B7X32_00695 [Microbacterium sp. 13-71-7]